MFDGLGHGVEAMAPEPEPGYPAAFRTIWQAGAATIPVDGEAEALLEPLTRWLLERGRAVPARQLAEALAWLAGFEERVIRQIRAVRRGADARARADAPAGRAGTTQQDGERNFAQQVQFTPFTSFVNVAGLPAITVPVTETATGSRWACSSSVDRAARRRCSRSPRSSSGGCVAATVIRRTGEGRAASCDAVMHGPRFRCARLR